MEADICVMLKAGDLGKAYDNQTLNVSCVCVRVRACLCAFSELSFLL